MLGKLHNWHRTKLGLLVFGAVELAIVYGVSSWAFSTGNLWLWLLTLIFLVGVLQNFVRLIGALVHGKRQTNQA